MDRRQFILGTLISGAAAILPELLPDDPIYKFPTDLESRVLRLMNAGYAQLLKCRIAVGNKEGNWIIPPLKAARKLNALKIEFVAEKINVTAATTFENCTLIDDQNMIIRAKHPFKNPIHTINGDSLIVTYTFGLEVR